MISLWVIAGVMLIAGTIGGIINSFNAEDSERVLTWWKHILIGIAASFMVPLFFSMISSDMIVSIRGIQDKQAGDPSKLFVLAGFCLVASISSRAFIRTISNKLIQDIQNATQTANEAKSKASEIAEIVAPLSEDDSSAPDRNLCVELVPAHPSISDEEMAILQSIQNSKFTRRSLGGIASGVKLDREVVNHQISCLIAKNLLTQSQTKDGRPLYSLTSEGRVITSS